MATIEERKIETLAFLRRVQSLNTKEVSKKDSVKLLAEFKNLEPVFISLNHSTIIKCFKIKNKQYIAYYNLFDYVIIDEIVN